MANTTLTASIGRQLYQTVSHTRQHEIVGDEPADLGGGDTGPTPSELLLASLATCTGATLRMYADRKGWDLAQVDIHLEMETEKSEGQHKTIIRRSLQFSGNLSEAEKQRLLDIAEKCPIHKLLTNEVVIETNTKAD